MTRGPRATSRGTAIGLMAAAALLMGPVLVARDQSRPSITLAWDANPEPDVIGYTVHVGLASRAYTEQHDAGNATSFTYFPSDDRRYYFAVSAYSRTSRSPVSAEVSDVAKRLNGTSERAGVRPSLADACRNGCDPASADSDALAPVTALAAAGDGRLFVIEDGRQIRVVVPGTPASAPALLAPDASTRFTAIVLDPAFEQTRHVYVAITRGRRDGTRELTIVRYREVHNVLGEGATVLTGLRLWGANEATFTVDAGRRFYVAMPADGRVHGDPYAGYVLWFNEDGSVPADSRGGSPVLAHGFAQPVALYVDGPALWVVGRDGSWQQSIARVPRTLSRADEWPRVLRGMRLSGTGDHNSTARVLSFAATVTSAAPEGTALVLDSTGRVHKIHASAKGLLHAQTVFSPGDETPVAMAVGSQRVFLAIRRPDGTHAITATSGGVP